MKTNRWKKVFAVIFSASIFLSAGAHSTYAASKYVGLEMRWLDGHIDHVETLLKDGVTYGSLFAIGSEASLRSETGDKGQVVLSGYKKRIVVHMGSNIAEVDGQKVDMGRKPVWYISHLYVPIRFLAAALGGKVADWDPKTGKVTVTGLHHYNDTFYGSMMGHSYVIHSETGDLEITNVYSGQKVTIPLGLKDINVNTHHLAMDFKSTRKNLLILSVTYTNRHTGEYDLYTLLFKNQGLIRKSVAHDLTEQYEIIQPDGNIQLIDDKNIRIVEDETGNILATRAR
ncbi:MAG TPA: copper amine oxidase N-terminal domain-containing protein [Bacilli bacterium]